MRYLSETMVNKLCYDLACRIPSLTESELNRAIRLTLHVETSNAEFHKSLRNHLPSFYLLTKACEEIVRKRRMVILKIRIMGIFCSLYAASLHRVWAPPHGTGYKMLCEMYAKSGVSENLGKVTDDDNSKEQ